MKYEEAIKSASMLIKFQCIEERNGNADNARDFMNQAAGAAKIIATIYSKWTENEEGYDDFSGVWYDMECAADLHGEEKAARFHL